MIYPSHGCLYQVSWQPMQQLASVDEKVRSYLWLPMCLLIRDIQTQPLELFYLHYLQGILPKDDDSASVA